MRSYTLRLIVKVSLKFCREAFFLRHYNYQWFISIPFNYMLNPNIRLYTELRGIIIVNQISAQ